MAKRGNVHKAKKRAKELSRQKTQEEKRRRHSKKALLQQDVQEKDADGRDEEDEG